MGEIGVDLSSLTHESGCRRPGDFRFGEKGLRGSLSSTGELKIDLVKLMEYLNNNNDIF